MNHPTDPPNSLRRSDSLWDEEFNKNSWREYQQERLANYEEKVAKRILNQFGLGNYISSLKKSAPSGLLRLENIRHLIPANIIFFASQPTYVHKVTVSDLYKRFTKTPIFNAFINGEALLEESGVDSSELEDGVLCMVFPWPSLSEMVTFYRGDPAADTDSFRISRVVRGVSYHIETLNDFFRGIGVGNVDI